MRSFPWLIAFLCFSYSTLKVMVYTLNGTVEDYRINNNDGSSSSLLSNINLTTKQREKVFYKHHSEQIQKIVAEISIIRWNHVRDDFDLHQLQYQQRQHHQQQQDPTTSITTTTTTNNHQHVDDEDDEEETSTATTAHTTTTTTQYIETRDICGLAQAFQRYRDSVVFTSNPHVLWWRNPTDNFDPALYWQEKGCSVSALLDYLHHPETLAVMVSSNTTGVKFLNHPKIFPISIGLFQDKTGHQQEELWQEIMENLPTRTSTITSTTTGGGSGDHNSHNNNRHDSLRILIVGDRRWESTRTMELKNRLEKIFSSGGSGGGGSPSKTAASSASSGSGSSSSSSSSSLIKAVYHPRDDDDHHELLYENFLKSKFVLGVGMGNDHDWIMEALALGAIPILEEDNQHNMKFKNGYQKVVLGGGEEGGGGGASLPIVWIDDYDNLSPELLEMEYAALLHKNPVTAFHYERMTQMYWIDRALQILEEMEEQRQRDAEEFVRLKEKRRKDKMKKKIFRIPKE